MPLLGRHKSNQSSSSSPPATAATQANQSPAAATAAANSSKLCDSPLFGMRRQLPTTTVLDASNYNDNNSSSSNSNLVGSQSSPKAGSGNYKQQQQLQSVNSNNNNSSNSNSTGLSSIPQQITRQQIHYAFSIMDSNKDGQVDVRDLSQMLSILGIPIDEAILAHVMKNTVSKRGDHKVSEAEFLDWISHFIQIRSESPPAASVGAGATGLKKGSGKTAVRVTRSSTAAGSSLIAQPSEMPRNRRGSGSGLALMRSLSSSSAPSSSQSSAAAAAASKAEQSSDNRSSSNKTNSNSKLSKTSNSGKQQLQQQSSTDSIEAKNDLKAAFCVFDLDGDGYITLDEVRAGLKLLGESWSPVELRRVFSKCGSNSSNSPTSDLTKQRISIDDFVQLLL